MTPEKINEIITIISMLAAIFFGYRAFSRGKKRDHQGEAAQMAVLNANMGAVRDGINEIRAQLAKNGDDNKTAHKAFYARLESGEKTLGVHDHKLENHEQRIGKLEEKQ